MNRDPIDGYETMRLPAEGVAEFEAMGGDPLDEAWEELEKLAVRAYALYEREKDASLLVAVRAELSRLAANHRRTA